MRGPTAPKALLFDVFGTCVDWRAGVIREGEALAARMELEEVDWGAVADAWRDRYQPQLERVRSGARPWTTLDVLHREALDDVLAELGIEGVPPAERDELTLAWHRLDPWRDVIDGLGRLRRLFIVAPCSNGHIALIVAMARRAGLRWDAVLGAEIAHGYKPQPEVYLRSVAALGLRPEEAMMVAAHPDDLVAAADLGLRTAYVPRPDEHGRGGTAPPAPEGVDVVADDFLYLARRFSA